MTYIQVAGSSSDSFVVEYQESSVGNHFRSERTDYSLEEICGILESFLANDNSWQISDQWIRVEISARPTNWEEVSALIGIAGFVFLLVMRWASIFSNDSKAFGLDWTEIMRIVPFFFVPGLISMLFTFKSLHRIEQVRIVLLVIGVAFLLYAWVR
jgi:hypothetical protein